MKYVIDSSVAIKIVLPEADSHQARAMIATYQSKLYELLAPDILLVEVAHALTRAERRKALKQGESISKLAQVASVGFDLRSYLPLLTRATALSSQMRIGVYDALYVALAEQEGCELVTADARLINSLPGFPLRALSAFPSNSP